MQIIIEVNQLTLHPTISHNIKHHIFPESNAINQHSGVTFQPELALSLRFYVTLSSIHVETKH